MHPLRQSLSTGACGWLKALTAETACCLGTDFPEAAPCRRWIPAGYTSMPDYAAMRARPEPARRWILTGLVSGNVDDAVLRLRAPRLGDLSEGHATCLHVDRAGVHRGGEFRKLREDVAGGDRADTAAADL